MNKGEVINLVYKSDLSKRAMLVILYLINRADPNMTCFPSVKRIAQDCSISPRTVQRALNDIIETGFLKRESRFHEKGGQRSNYYTILKGEVKIREENLFQDEIIRDDNEIKVEQLPKISVFQRLKQSLGVILS
ncbi:helix-turn-helix domain-containing protein [Vallitalea guaymasensis]|uniref:Helix-turn-helix domain-containing protein n=1 Tax=Vallitalea guaymasensis TaxID=1185412 RepID=A0A8J8SE29_9FIRM|nr:helix-turn-helix domain-containing protein [Vallitalea guaymasensis]QUH31135.1 helix-turn-helix domain-containing protein [Vallitalea guaymasensis]